MSRKATKSRSFARFARPQLGAARLNVARETRLPHLGNDTSLARAASPHWDPAPGYVLIPARSGKSPGKVPRKCPRRCFMRPRGDIRFSPSMCTSREANTGKLTHRRLMVDLWRMGRARQTFSDISRNFKKTKTKKHCPDPILDRGLVYHFMCFPPVVCA